LPFFRASEFLWRWDYWGYGDKIDEDGAALPDVIYYVVSKIGQSPMQSALYKELYSQHGQVVPMVVWAVWCGFR
jgi:hypothetical protein